MNSFDDSISKRCGKSICECYDKYNRVSGCFMFNDRRQCPKSMRQRKKAKAHSQKRDSRY